MNKYGLLLVQLEYDNIVFYSIGYKAKLMHLLKRELPFA